MRIQIAFVPTGLHSSPPLLSHTFEFGSINISRSMNRNGKQELPGTELCPRCQARSKGVIKFLFYTLKCSELLEESELLHAFFFQIFQKDLTGNPE